MELLLRTLIWINRTNERMDGRKNELFPRVCRVLFGSKKSSQLKTGTFPFDESIQSVKIYSGLNG